MRLYGLILLLNMKWKFILGGYDMSEITRYDVNDQWAHSGMAEAGDGILFQIDAIAYKKGHINE